MNHPKSPNSQLLQFMLRAQQLARQDVKTDKGYAMMMTSIITIMLFSLMGAFLTMTNLAKSSTDAYIDGNSTFYASESGLNKRVQELRDRFDRYNSPGDGATTVADKNTPSFRPTSMSTCYESTAAAIATRDFECKPYTFIYNNNIARTAGTSANTIVLSEADGNSSKVEYKAFTFVADKTNYDTASVPAPIPIVLTDGDYKGLNAQEYKYTVNATAAKQNANTAGSQIGSSGENKTVLQMDFKSRAIPLFQFGAFYEGDLELNPSPTMTFNGRLHTNKDMYLTAGTIKSGISLRIDGNLTAYNGIYIGNRALADTYLAAKTVQIVTVPGSSLVTDILWLTKNPYKPSTIDSTTPAPNSTPAILSEVTNLDPYNQRLKSHLGSKLKVPPVALLAKVDTTKPNNVGEYYGKADLRLEMLPNNTSVPFKLEVIASGETTNNDSCATAPFSSSNVSVDRADYNKLRCKQLAEGQLRSLMQPVLVRPRSDAEFDKFCTAPSPTAPSLSAAATLPIKERILDALYFTLAAQTAPIKYSSLNTTINAFSSTSYQFAAPSGTPVLDGFNELLTKINSSLAPSDQLTSTDISNLKAATPVQIAALSSTSTTTAKNITVNKQRSCFIPAPIQALFTPGTTTTSFYDRREQRKIQMLQTNIQSLTLWNRDGLFVSSFSATDDASAIATKFGAMTPANNSGNDVLFVKAAPELKKFEYDATLTGTNKYKEVDTPLNSFRNMGLAAKDRTEGGLVIHATINKASFTYTVKQSPYGFAFNGGANLPAPLTIATDQAVYSQGDWNSVDKQPASFLADTISVLSNSCIANTDNPASGNTLGYLAGQLNCGAVDTSLKGPPPLVTPASTTIINAAFLGRTDISDPTASPKYYSGGLNNYMRILEDWRNTTMVYRGSFVSLGAPLEVSGQFKDCKKILPTDEGNYACPPDRQWDYETSFNSYEGLPPLAPKVIEIQQDSFRRKFN
jgi:hypothetical protein